MKRQISPRLKLSRTVSIIQSLNGGGERREHWEVIRNLLNVISEGHLFLGSTLPDESVFYRGRKLEESGHFSELKDLLARKPQEITSFGRCNKPGQSVLYASTNYQTVYSELGLHTDDRVQTVAIRLKPGAKVRTTVIGEIDHVRRYGIASSIAIPGTAEAIKEHWSRLSELERLQLNLTDAFIADKFRANSRYQFDYKITSAFSDIVFSLGANFDAFFYPSVGHLGGWNIAVKAERFGECFDVVIGPHRVVRMEC